MKPLIYPFQAQIVLREELIHRYVIALAEVLSIAKDDPELEKLIDQMEVAFAYP